MAYNIEDAFNNDGEIFAFEDENTEPDLTKFVDDFLTRAGIEDANGTIGQLIGMAFYAGQRYESANHHVALLVPEQALIKGFLQTMTQE